MLIRQLREGCARTFGAHATEVATSVPEGKRELQSLTSPQDSRPAPVPGPSACPLLLSECSQAQLNTEISGAAKSRS